MKTKVTSPAEFFGFQMGADRKIARWDKIVEYFRTLEKETDKIKVTDMGPSTEGNPFLLVTISSSKNLKTLDKLRDINAKITDPRRLEEGEIDRLIERGKVVICQSMSLHASEIGGTQMAPELAYDLLTREDEETRRILDNVVFLMIPSFNPDGQIMVADYYNKWLGTEYEGGSLPYLYHRYVGHDNNRDAFATNMVESQYAAKIMYQEWHPEAYQDHHHMGSYGARLFLAPYCEPIHPYADPLIWREHSWYGAHMAYKLEESNKTGIINDAQYAGWGHFGFHWIGNYHNIASMLTESASAKLATPIYVHPEQLSSSGGPLRGFASYKPQTNMPHPWPGGWWRLRDIVEQQKIAAWALLDIAARHKETVLRNAYLKARRQTERGASETPKAYVIPPFQNDLLTAEKLVEKLLLQGIEIRMCKKGFTFEGQSYPKGTYVISLEQPKMGLIKSLLGRTFYPDDAWSRASDGSPLRPYDTATDTMAEFMGVRVDALDFVPEDKYEVLTEYKKPVGEVQGTSKIGYVYDGRLNQSFKATNILLEKGVKLRRTDERVTTGGIVFPTGSFIASGGSERNLNEVAQETGVDFHALDKEVPKAHAIKALRIAMYQRYWGGNMDEGWTRWLLEDFKFPYKTVFDKDIKDTDFDKKYDVLILPSDATPLITGENLEEYYSRQRFGTTMPKYPEEYRSGIGKDGAENIKKFVESGGTLITFNQACEFAIEKLGLKVQNVLKDVRPKDFFCPGSTLRARADAANPLAYGMPNDFFLLFLDSLAFNLIPSDFNENYEIVVKYPERDILQSGWLVGEEKIVEKAAMVSAKHGKGRVILIGFRVQHRAQTHGTFKLLFNALCP